MRFISYLIENRTEVLTEKHDLVLQKVIDALDNSHVDYSPTKITFDVGDVSNTPKLKGLKLVIRPGQTNEVKLGKSRDGVFAIVVSTTEDLPGRQEIDSFLSSSNIYSGFKNAYTQYVQNFHDHDKDYEPSDSEVEISLNNRNGFESSYNDLIDAIRNHTKQYEDSVKELDAEEQRVANIGRKKTIEVAKSNLRTEYLGADGNEFATKVLKLPQADFAKHLNKEWKEKLQARLVNYFNQNF